MTVQITFHGTPGQVKSEMAALLGLPTGPFAAVPINQPQPEPAAATSSETEQPSPAVAEAGQVQPAGAVSETPKRRGRPPKAQQSSEGPTSTVSSGAAAEDAAAQSAEVTDKGPTAPSEPLSVEDVREHLSNLMTHKGELIARRLFTEFPAAKGGDDNGKARRIGELDPDDYAKFISRAKELLAAPAEG